MVAFVGANGVVFDQSSLDLVVVRLNPGKGITFDIGSFSKCVECPFRVPIDSWPYVVLRNFEWNQIRYDGIGEPVCFSSPTIQAKYPPLSADELARFFTP